MMIRIGIVGDIGSGKTFVANNFGYPVFNADYEVSKLYKNNKNIFSKLKRQLPKYISTFPLQKSELTNAILSNKKNLKIIINLVHKEVRKKLKIFLNKNRNRKIVILDIPLLIENKIYKKNDVLIFVDSKKKDIDKKIKKRPNYNVNLINMFRKIQLNPVYKKKKSNYIIENKFKKEPIKKEIKKILTDIL
ncbi:dephospho-CoA kinase [Candidatus Pelagibacter sp. HIMB1611]|uniref:dephospho-CoA kinase n=1 Tax=unclassified Candidatus Pelagibacter TaxID=2647897 RepID=UPI003F82FC4A